ncbi:MAG: hypothetical protein ACPGSM_10045 [Thiolinea sp.]
MQIQNKKNRHLIYRQLKADDIKAIAVPTSRTGKFRDLANAQQKKRTKLVQKLLTCTAQVHSV